MKSGVSIRILDTANVDRLSQLTAIARENGLAISIDLIGTSAKHSISKETWIVQIYDDSERLIISGRGRCLNDAVRAAHESYFSKTAPKL